MEERVRWRHKFSQVTSKAQNLAAQVSSIRKMMANVLSSVKFTQKTLEDDEMIGLNEQKFSSYLEYFMGEQRQ